MFFDIETTGLSASRSHLYLIGCAWQIEANGEKKWLLRQCFLDNPAHEKELLAGFSDLLTKRNIRTLIHYNGSTFDIPYLEKKYSFYRMKNPLESFRSEGGTIDLYRTIRPFRRLLGTDSLKQKDAERLIGIRRRDRFSGKELIGTYREYLLKGDPELLNAMFLHNAEDVANMLPIYPLTGLSTFFGGGFTIRSVGMTAHPGPGDLRIRLAADCATPIPIRSENDFCSLIWEESSALLTVRPFCGTLKHFFPDYRNYYYLPEEDQAIHKSVGAFVDPAHRVPAKAATCYQKKSGTFLPQPRDRVTPVFRNDYRSKHSYFLYEPDRVPEGSVSESVSFTAYILDLLETLIL